jgi:hypothetical protein
MFVSVPIKVRAEEDSKGSRGYISIDAAAKDAEHRREVKTQVRRMIAGLRKRLALLDLLSRFGGYLDDIEGAMGD